MSELTVEKIKKDIEDLKPRQGDLSTLEFMLFRDLMFLSDNLATIERETAEKCADLVNNEQLVENLDCPEDSAYSRAIDCASYSISSHFNLGETP